MQGHAIVKVEQYSIFLILQQPTHGVNTLLAIKELEMPQLYKFSETKIEHL